MQYLILLAPPSMLIFINDQSHDRELDGGLISAHPLAAVIANRVQAAACNNPIQQILFTYCTILQSRK